MRLSQKISQLGVSVLRAYVTEHRPDLKRGTEDERGEGGDSGAEAASDEGDDGEEEEDREDGEGEEGGSETEVDEGSADERGG
jgi:hypothetical protein